MQPLSKQIDQHLIDLAWSLWTELGVAGIKRQHQYCLIALEELVLLTSVVAETDPRLRDEALDWCSRYHPFVSISRLRALVKVFAPYVSEPFSAFAATLNSVSRSNWPVFTKVTPLELTPSGKSKTPQCELPALLCLRLRVLFGAGARADLMTFFLTRKQSDFTVSDTIEIGYGKRSLAMLLEDFVQSGLFEVFTTRNQRNYRFIKREQMAKTLGHFPKIVPLWRQFLEVLLPLRACILRVEKKSAAIKMTEIRNHLIKTEDTLRKLNLSPPPMEPDPLFYWDTFTDWILNITQSYAQGDFGDSALPLEETIDAAKRIKVQFKGLFSNIESLSTHSNEKTKDSLFENYKKAFQKQLAAFLPKLDANDQIAIKELEDRLLSKDKNSFTVSLKNKVLPSIDQILEKYLRY